MKIYILSVFVFIFSCSVSKNTKETRNIETLLEESEFGYVNLHVSADNNQFIYYQLGMFDIWLIDDKGSFYQYKSEKSADTFKLDLTSLSSKNQLVMRIPVPAGVYVGLKIFFDYGVGASEIVLKTDGEYQFATLVDEFSQKLTGDNAFIEKNILFETNEYLIVEGDRSSQLSINIDIESSMRVMPTKKNDTGLVFLINPVMDISPEVYYPSNVFVEGFIKAVNGDQIDLVPMVSEFMRQPRTSINVKNSQIINVNHIGQTLRDFTQKINEYINSEDAVFVRIRGHYESNIFMADDISAIKISDKSNLLLDGFIYKKEFIGKMTPLDRTQAPSKQGFYNGKINSVEEGALVSGFSGYVNAIGSLDNTAKLESIIPVVSDISGVISKLDSDQLVLNAMSINNVNYTDISETSLLPIKLPTSLLKKMNVSEPVSVSGYFNEDGQYEMVSLTSLKEAEVRYQISLPLSTKNKILVINGDRLTIDKNIVTTGMKSLKSLSRAMWLLSDVDTVEHIDIEKARFILLSEPDGITQNFYTKDRFLSAFTDRIDNGFVVNSLVVDGLLNDDILKAGVVIITMQANTKEGKTSNSSGLSGGLYRDKGMLKGPAYLHYSRVKSPFRYFTGKYWAASNDSAKLPFKLSQDYRSGFMRDASNLNDDIKKKIKNFENNKLKIKNNKSTIKSKKNNPTTNNLSESSGKRVTNFYSLDPTVYSLDSIESSPDSKRSISGTTNTNQLSEKEKGLLNALAKNFQDSTYETIGESAKVNKFSSENTYEEIGEGSKSNKLSSDKIQISSVNFSNVDMEQKWRLSVGETSSQRLSRKDSLADLNVVAEYEKVSKPPIYVELESMYQPLTDFNSSEETYETLKPKAASGTPIYFDLEEMSFDKNVSTNIDNIDQSKKVIHSIPSPTESNINSPFNPSKKTRR